MSLSDPIANLLTKVRNGQMAKHRYVDVCYSKMNKQIVQVLKDTGFVENFLINEKEFKVRVFLKYSKQRESVIQGLKRHSKPGLRRYVGYKEIPKVLGGLGISVLSTPEGVIDGETAKKKKVGGELLCYVW
jgi:small subunit ribosomal protein S8